MKFYQNVEVALIHANMQA